MRLIMYFLIIRWFFFLFFLQADSPFDLDHVSLQIHFFGYLKFLKSIFLFSSFSTRGNLSFLGGSFPRLELLFDTFLNLSSF